MNPDEKADAVISILQEHPGVKYAHHKCGGCHYMVGYVYEKGAGLHYDSNCGCVSRRVPTKFVGREELVNYFRRCLDSPFVINEFRNFMEAYNQWIEKNT